MTISLLLLADTIYRHNFGPIHYNIPRIYKYVKINVTLRFIKERYFQLVIFKLKTRVTMSSCFPYFHTIIRNNNVAVEAAVACIEEKFTGTVFQFREIKIVMLFSKGFSDFYT